MCVCSKGHECKYEAFHASKLRSTRFERSDCFSFFYERATNARERIEREAKSGRT